MESNSNNKSGLLTAGGVLNLVAGILEVIGYPLLVVNSGSAYYCSRHSRYSGRDLGHKKAKFWDVLSRGYLCPSNKHFRDIGSYFYSSVKERI